MSHNPEPSKFLASIGGYTGSSYSVRWEGGWLIYESYGYGYEKEDELRYHPAFDEWERFWDAIDGINLWTWEDRYENPDMMDGTNWSVELVWGDQQIKSYGSNAYPPKFKQFCAAVSGLLQGRTFQ